MENNQQSNKIDLINLMIRFKNAFFQFWPVMVVLVVVFGLLSTYKAKREFVPMYQSKAIFTVDSGYTAEDIFGTGSAYYDQYAAQQMADIFPQMLNMAVMTDLVAEELDSPYPNGHAYAESVTDSNMLVLTVESDDPQDAYDYLKAIFACYPKVAVYMVDNPYMVEVESPTVPTAPCNSFSPVEAAMKGVLIGLAVSIVIMLAMTLSSRTIQTADELKSVINLPILVALPRVTLKKRRKGAAQVISADSNGNMSESLRGLRMKVKKHLEDAGKKTILVTSTLAGEGKTTVAVNLAQSLVKDGHKVIILDADFRHQSVAKFLGEPGEGTSLLDCLKDSKHTVSGCIRSTNTGLCFVSGSSTDKRQYTIEYRAMRQILEELSKEFDYIVLDTPPSEVVSDATALCRYAECVIYVVRQDFAKRGQVINAVTALHQKDVNITGCVFNGVPQFHRHYGYGYRSTYGYGYDYGYRKYSYGNKYGYGKYGYSRYGKHGKDLQKK